MIDAVVLGDTGHAGANVRNDQRVRDGTRIVGAEGKRIAFLRRERRVEALLELVHQSFDVLLISNGLYMKAVVVPVDIRDDALKALIADVGEKIVRVTIGGWDDT
jgi:hypothetical protein